MSFQTLPLPPALHYLLFSFTWPAPAPYSPAPHQPLSKCTGPFPSVLCQIVWCVYLALLGRLILNLPACLLTFLFACSYWIDLPVWTLDLPCCLLLLDLFATRNDYLVWPLLGINTVSAPEPFLLSCYWVLVGHLVKPDAFVFYRHSISILCFFGLSSWYE